MTDKTPLLERSELEPPMPELSRLRQLSRFDVPSSDVKRSVYARVQDTLNASVASARPQPRARAWALTLAITVAVPSAFAATPAGTLVVQHTVAWAAHLWAVVDSATALKDTPRTREAPPTRGTHQIQRAHQSQPAPQNSAQQIPTPSAPSAPPAPLASSSSAEATEASPAVAEVAPSQVHTAATAPSAQAPGSAQRTRTRAPEPPSTLTAERQLLEAARVRLRAGDMAGASTLAARHARRFPNGILTAERRAIINQVHQLQGQTP